MLPCVARAPPLPRPVEAAAAARDATAVGGALRGHQRVRTISLAERHRHPEVLSSCLEGRTAEALSRAARRSVEELEVRARRSVRARSMGRLPAGIRARPVEDE